MEILLDTANIAAIKKYVDVINLAGITTNPTIVKKEGKIDFFNHMKEIRQIIGPDAKLHVQAVGKTRDEFIQDAYTIWDKIDKDIYVKIRATEEGLAAIKTLKNEDKKNIDRSLRTSKRNNVKSPISNTHRKRTNKYRKCAF